MSDPGQPSVLIVDDDEVDVRAVSRSLRRSGFDGSIVVADKGRVALEILARPAAHSLRWPYVVLLDLNMPGMSGHEFLEALRSDPRLEATTVFVLTTSSNERDVARAYARQVAGYIVKTDVGRDFEGLASMLTSYLATVRFGRAAVGPSDLP